MNNMCHLPPVSIAAGLLSTGGFILRATILFGLTTLMAYRKLHSQVAFARYGLSHPWCPRSDPPPAEMQARIIDHPQY